MQIEEQCAESALDALRILETAYGRTFRTPELAFDLRGRTAGLAYYGTPRIRINLSLAERNTEHFLRETVPHEVAHLVSFELYGSRGRGHGAHWKSVYAHARS